MAVQLKRNAQESDLEGAGPRSLEGVGTLLACKKESGVISAQVQVGPQVLVHMETDRPGAWQELQFGMISVGAKVAFKAKVLSIEGTDVEVGALEINLVQASVQDSLLAHVDRFNEVGEACLGRETIRLPKAAAGRPFTLRGRPEGEEIRWEELH